MSTKESGKARKGSAQRSFFFKTACTEDPPVGVDECVDSLRKNLS